MLAWLLAEIAAVPTRLTDLLVPEIGNLTATAILGWYAWHTASRTIPALVAAFREEMAAARADALLDRETFHLELAAERQQRHDDHREIVQALHEVTAALPHASRDAAPHAGRFATET